MSDRDPARMLRIATMWERVSSKTARTYFSGFIGARWFRPGTCWCKSAVRSAVRNGARPS
jgi:hypothetical protein